jgi:uncharacterized DUF497 family protein
MFVWDEAKRITNRRKHGVDFASVQAFEFETAVVVIDDREDYGELREIALGFIGPVLHHLTFTRRGSDIRVISLRKAEKKEIRIYVQHQS